MNKRILTPALLATFLALGGCSAINSVATPAPQGEDYSARTAGMKVEDETIESKIQDTMTTTDARLDDARVGVNSYNGVVLLFGQVPSQELKDLAGQIAQDTRQVRQVYNELTVAANLPLGQRLKDDWLETSAQTVLAANKDIDTRHLEVIAENATLYLMGTVTRDEAQRVVSEVSGINGVQRIVKIFEYLD
ncbi:MULTISPECIES: BON domain-containing protein [Halomonadaceae]|uniref:BON domain-containing protein n=1 Tax=Modicisalibacter zincidurans TaxID=1178777 RepID=A0ABP9RHN9_9GAMM|nr:MULTISPECIES: BON domain-containing protein [Halomonas]MCD6008342.1 BON domain-containing protein [Halomonas sp. IOP_31]